MAGGLTEFTNIVPGSAVEGLITGGGGTLINQAINGELDLQQAAINGLLSAGINVVGDYFSDARQTALPQYEGTRLENTSDLGGLVGPGGLFDSIDPVGTGWLNDNILDPILGAAKFVIVDPNGNRYFADNNGVIDFGDGTIINNYVSYSVIRHKFNSPGIHIVTASSTINGKSILQKQKVIVFEDRL